MFISSVSYKDSDFVVWKLPGVSLDVWEKKGVTSKKNEILFDKYTNVFVSKTWLWSKPSRVSARGSSVLFWGEGGAQLYSSNVRLKRKADRKQESL